LVAPIGHERAASLSGHRLDDYLGTHLITDKTATIIQVEHIVNNLVFDRQGKTLAAALHDGTVKIWPTE
jgi:WD40 repeat protein